MKPKLLVVGANGQVGWELVRQAESAGFACHTLTSEQLNICVAKMVSGALVASQADIVINAAAYTAVDKAEQEAERAFAVNRDGPAHLANVCKQLHIPLLQLSTDYVFNGTKKDAYDEDDPVAPLGVYGQSKWEGEQAVRQLLPQHIIVRLSWVFGVHGHNFVKTMLRLAREREQVRVVADQQGCPSYAGDIAHALLTIAKQVFSRSSVWGTYHYCGTPLTSWHGFAQAIIDTASQHISLAVKEVTAISTAAYPTPAARPVNSALDCSRIERVFGIRPKPWQVGMQNVIQAELDHEQTRVRETCN